MGIFLLGSPSDGSHNGGRSQFNTAALGYSGSFEFLNLLKTGQNWGYVSPGGAWVDPAACAFDVNGYPTAIPVGKNGLIRLVYITTQAERPGNWVVLWDGGGTIYVGNGSTVGGTSKTALAATVNNRYEFSMSGVPTTTSITIGVASVISSSEYPKNIRFCHIDDEAALNAGGVFGERFLAKLRESGVGVMRALSWGGSDGNGMNDSAITTWDSRKPVGYVSYSGEEMRLSYYAGETTNISDAYSITPIGTYALGSSAPVHNEKMIVKWSSTSVGHTPTLTKGGVTKPIIKPSGIYLSGGINTGRPGIGIYGLCIFNSKLDAWLCFSTTTTSAYLVNGCPPEIWVQLCIELGAHPYFPTPYLAADPLTDYVPSLAAYIRDNGPSWMIPRFEPPNELWNNANAFYGTQYAQSVQLIDNGGSLTATTSFTATAMSWTGSGTTGESTITIGTNTLVVGSTLVIATSGGPFGFNNVLATVTEKPSSTVVKVNRAPTGGSYVGGVTSVVMTCLSNDLNNWYGKVTSIIGQAVADVYSVAKANVATQNLYHMILGIKTVSTTSDSDTRATALSYVLREGGDPAKEWVTHICCANYFGPSLYETATEDTLALAYDGGDLTALDTYVASCGGASSNLNIAYFAAKYSEWKIWAQGHNINKMCGYEGGYSADYTTSTSAQVDDPVIDNLRRDAKMVSALGTYHDQNFENFLDLTDGTFTAEFPSDFLPFGKLPDDNSWSIMVNIYQTPDPPIWTAICAFNA